MFAEALPAVETFRSPRASAFTLLGLDAYCARFPMIVAPSEIRYLLADRLMSGLASVETPDWLWFEEGLAYDNARLPQALIVTGMATQTPGYVEAGLTIPALADDATNGHPTGHFRPSAPPVSANCGNRLARSINSRWKPPQRSPPA